jgi:hypothetical protein
MTTEMTTEQKKARIEVIDIELEELNKKVIALEDERNELVKSVRKAIKAELQATADKYGFVIRNKTKPKTSKEDTTKASEQSTTTD